MDYNSFDEFEQVLYKLSESTKYPTKKDAPLISPATYIPDTTRGNDNVTGWGMWCALDIDEFEGDIEQIKKAYGEYRFVCYSTASSTEEQPKFRLVFPLNKEVHKEDIKHFWFALNKEIGDVADAQTKDLSRMYYVPAKYKDAFNFIFSQDCKYICFIRLANIFLRGFIRLTQCCMRE